MERIEYLDDGLKGRRLESKRLDTTGYERKYADQMLDALKRQLAADGLEARMVMVDINITAKALVYDAAASGPER